MIEYAFKAVIDRHESLRTYFVTDQDGTAQQVIKEKLDELPIDEYDLSDDIESRHHHRQIRLVVK